VKTSLGFQLRAVHPLGDNCHRLASRSLAGMIDRSPRHARKGVSAPCEQIAAAAQLRKRSSERSSAKLAGSPVLRFHRGIVAVSVSDHRATPNSAPPARGRCLGRLGSTAPPTCGDQGVPHGSGISFRKRDSVTIPVTKSSMATQSNASRLVVRWAEGYRATSRTRHAGHWPVIDPFLEGSPSSSSQPLLLYRPRRLQACRPSLHRAPLPRLRC